MDKIVSKFELLKNKVIYDPSHSLLRAFFKS